MNELEDIYNTHTKTSEATHSRITECVLQNKTEQNHEHINVPVIFLLRVWKTTFEKWLTPIRKDIYESLTKKAYI